MQQFWSTLKAVSRSRLLRRNGIITFIRQPNNADKIGKYVPARYFRSRAGFDYYSSANTLAQIHSMGDYLFTANNFSQRRWFLGCGDGEEGSALSKVHEERLVIGYSPEQLFAVVAAVDIYVDFVPWCQRSDIMRHYPDGSFDAELEIGFKFLVESYVSHVVLNKPNSIKTTASESNLFEHLINVWEFSPGPTPGTCNVYFLVDFKFRSPLYRKVASMFFEEVVSRLVSSFTDRCRLIYGPEAPSLRKIEQKA